MSNLSFSKEFLFEETSDFYWQALDENSSLVVINEQGLITYASRLFVELTGYGAETQLKVWDLIETANHPEGIRQEISGQIQAGKTWKRQLWIRTKSGEPIRVKAAFYPWPGHTQPIQHFMVFFAENQAQAPHFQNQNSEILKSISWAQDLRNPINHISALCELMSETPLSEPQADLVRRLIQSSEILSGIIDDMLQPCTEIPYDMKSILNPFGLKKTIEEFSQLIGKRAETKGIQISTEIDDTLPQCVFGDQRRLNQIIIYLAEYLISNPNTRSVRISALAEKYGPENCEVSFFVLGQFSMPENRLIQDNEPDEILSLTLEKVKYNLDMLKGKVLLQEKNAKAFYCHFVLQFALQPAEGTQNKIEPFMAGNFFSENIKILIAEDVEINQLVMKHQLLKIGIEAQFARTGFGVLEKLQNENFDLILMDVQMPGLDGLQTIEAIRANKLRPYHDLPIIGISASIGPSAREKCLAAGANDFVPQPYELQELKNKISNLITEYRIKSKAEMKPNTTEFNKQETEKYFDLRYLEEISEGDKEFSATLISYFTDNTPKVLTSLKEEIQNQNWEQVRLIAHKFKPQVQYMGIHQISEVVEQVEQNAHKREQLDQIWPMMQRIDKICLVAIEQLKAELKKMHEL